MPASTASHGYLKTDMLVVNMGWFAERVIEMNMHACYVKPGEPGAMQSDGCKLGVTFSQSCFFIKDNTTTCCKEKNIIMRIENAV